MPGQRERERERWRAENRAADVFKHGGNGGVIRGSFALEFGREKKAMVRNGECGAEQRSKEGGSLTRGGP